MNGDGMNETPQGKGGSLTARTLWLMAAKTLAFAFSFALPLLLVRRLSQAEFGLYKQAFLVVGTAISVLPLGFAMSAFYFLPRERERRGQVVLNILLFQAAVGGLACLALVIHPRLLVQLFNSPELLPLAPLIGLVILLWTVSSFLETVAVAHQETTLSTAFIVAAQLTKTLLLVGAAIGFGSVSALVYAAAVQGGLQTIILLVYLRSRFRGFWRDFDGGMMRVQLAYALPLGFSGVLFALQNDLHNYFVSNQFGAAAFAVYAIGCFQLPLVGILGESIGSVMIPRVSLLQKQGEAREIIRLTARVMRKLAAVYFPLYVFLMVVGREFLVFLFTPAYLASWPVFAVNLTLLPVYVLVFDPVMRAYAEQRFFLLRVKVAVFAAVFAALWLGTARLGLTGVIALVVAANVAERLIAVARAGRVLGVTRRDATLLKDVGKVAAASVAAGGAAFFARHFVLEAGPFAVLAVCGLVFSATYLAAVLALGVPTSDERHAAQRAVARLSRLVFWGRAGASAAP